MWMIALEYYYLYISQRQYHVISTQFHHSLLTIQYPVCSLPIYVAMYYHIWYTFPLQSITTIQYIIQSLPHTIGYIVWCTPASVSCQEVSVM